MPTASAPPMTFKTKKQTLGEMEDTLEHLRMNLIEATAAVHQAGERNKSAEKASKEFESKHVASSTLSTSQLIEKDTLDIELQASISAYYKAHSEHATISGQIETTRMNYNSLKSNSDVDVTNTLKVAGAFLSHANQVQAEADRLNAGIAEKNAAFTVLSKQNADQTRANMTSIYQQSVRR